MAFNTVERVPDRVPIRNILVSVFDKNGLEELLEGVSAHCPDASFYSTGGTYRRIESILGDADRLHAVSEITGQPEMQGGLVKTLDYKIYLGLLSEPENPAHDDDIARTGSVVFDAVIVNLYPFGSVISEPGITVETARGNIDIGGPTMLRASAKNFIRVVPICDPSDYGAFVAELSENSGTIGMATRFALAGKAFAHTATYDRAIADYLASSRTSDLPYELIR